MECLSALSISALLGSIASGVSGVFNSVKACFTKKKKSNNNINSYNTNNTEIGSISVTSNDYRSYCKQRNGNSHR